MDSLSSFLEEQRRQGRVESSGEFSLALDRARAKLSKMALRHPADFILKLVQAAVAVDGQEVHVKLMRDYMLFFFEAPAHETTLDFNEVRRGLADPLDQTGALRHLVTGLNASLRDDIEEMIWGQWNEGGGRLLLATHQQTEIFCDPPFPRVEPLSPGRTFYLCCLRRLRSIVQIGAGHWAGEHKAIWNQAGFSDVPVYLDGHRVRPRLPTPEVDHAAVGRLTQPYWGALTFEADSDNANWPGKTTRLLQGGPTLYKLEGVKEPILGLNPKPGSQPLQWQRIYALPIHLTGPARLFFVKDGVLLEPTVVCADGAGAMAIVRDAQVQTDLTAMHAIVNDELRDQQRRAERAWNRQADELIEADLPCIVPKRLEVDAGTLWTGGVLGFWMLGPLGLLIPLGIWLKACVAGTSGRATRPAAELRPAVADRLAQVEWRR